MVLFLAGFLFILCVLTCLLMFLFIFSLIMDLFECCLSPWRDYGGNVHFLQKKCNEELVPTKCGLAGFFCPFGVNVF